MIKTFHYTKSGVLEANIPRARMLSILREKEGLLWVDMEAPTDFESEALVEIFNFHPLAVEDCLSDRSEPKVDDYGEYLFIVMHALTMREDEGGTKELGTIELNIFFSENYIVTFHKEPVASIAQVRALVQKNPLLLMAQGSDLLAHSLLDHLVDSYSPVLHQYDEIIDDLEKELFKNPSSDYLSTLLQVKQDIFTLRRIVGPQRDTVSLLTRKHTIFIDHKHLIYFRDIYDHLFRMYKMAEGFHENLTSILQVYFSYSSNKLNEVMKRLTVLASLTMPAVIIASIYGMNFNHMPELVWKHGYLFSIGLMAIVSISMLIWMKIKKWI